MAKRDDQKRKERELDLNMRWGDSKDGKNRDRVRDRGRSRSRSEERTPGLYALSQHDYVIGLFSGLFSIDHWQAIVLIFT